MSALLLCLGVAGFAGFASPSRLQSGVYNGKLLGVNADVVLDTKTSSAQIELRGLPVGGRVRGIAHFDANTLDVRLGGRFDALLKTLGVKILKVQPDPSLNSVRLTVKLPVFLGTREVVLIRRDAVPKRQSPRGGRCVL